MTGRRTLLTQWTLQLVTTIAILTTWPTSSSGQTSTEPVTTEKACVAPRRCYHPDDVNAAIDAACRRARVAELESEELVDDVDACETQRDVERGRRIEAVAHPDPVVRRSPWPLRAGLLVAIAAGGIATGAAAASRAPGELIVGFAVLELALLGGSLILQWVDDRPPAPRVPRS